MSAYFVTLKFEIDADTEDEADGVAHDLADEAIYNPWVKDIIVGEPSSV